MQYSVQVEETSKITRKLTVKVAAATVESHFAKGLQEVQRTAKIKGFRPGLVPISVVRQYYGDDVKHRVFHNLIDESFQAAIREKQIKAVGSPKIETPDHQTGQGSHDHTLKEGEELTYIATVEILPEIEVKGYTGIALTRDKSEVTDEDVKKVIDNFLDGQAQMIPASGGLVGADGKPSSRPVRKGDYADLTFTGGLVTDKGVEAKEGMKGTRTLEVGSDSLIPGFEEQLIDMRAGETKTFRIPFPADFYEKEMAGKEAEFTCTINELKEKKLPELNDDFAKQAGYESLVDMRTKAREHLVTEKATNVDRKLKNDLVQALIEKNPFDVPATLVQAQVRALAQDVGQNLKNQGFTDQMVQEALMAEVTNLKTRAESQVRASLLLESIAKKEGIEIGAKDIDAEYAKMATSMNVEPDKIIEFYTQNQNRLEDLKFRMREERTMTYLLEKSKVKDAK